MKKGSWDRSRYPYVYEVKGENLEPHTIWMLRPFDVHAKTFKCRRCGKCVFRARNQKGKRIMISAEKDHRS